MTRALLAAWAGRVCQALAWATIVLAPTQWSLRVGIAHLSLADVLIVAAAGAWLLRVAAAGAWRDARRLPWQVWAFLLPACASIAVAEIKPLAFRDAWKLFEYFALGWLVYDDLLRAQPRRMKALLWLFVALLAAQTALAWSQYLTAEDPLRVRGAFGNRNVLAGWLALTLPLICGVAIYAGAWPTRLALALLALLGLAVDLTAASCWAVIGVAALLAAARGWRAFAAVALVAMLWMTLVTPRIGWFHAARGERVTNEQALFQSLALYNADGAPERRYPGWQAAAEMMVTSPWLGVGLGNYQRQVGLYTGAKPSFTGPSEPDIQNLYLVIGASMGLPALLGFLALLLTPLWRAGVAAARLGDWRRGLAAGVAGAIAAFAVTAVWHPLLVRGIGLQLVLLLVAARVLAEEAANGATSRNA
jgi:O-antigen ligase